MAYEFIGILGSSCEAPSPSRSLVYSLGTPPIPSIERINTEFRNIARTAPDKRNQPERDRDKDISEEIAIGHPLTIGARSTEVQFDQRLFRQSKVRQNLSLSVLKEKFKFNLRTVTTETRAFARAVTFG